MTVTGSFWMGVENTVILNQFGGSRIPEIEGEIGGQEKALCGGCFNPGSA